MFLTVHAAAGVAIGTFVPNVPLAFGLGLLSHFLLDRVPHYDPPIVPGTRQDGVFHHPVFRRFLVISAADFALAAASTAALLDFLPGTLFPRVAGAFGAILPDLLFGLYRLTAHPWLERFNRFHQWLHFDPKEISVTLISGMATQLVALTISLIVLIR